MQYRLLGKTGERVSALGYGCMRLPSLDSPFGGEKIDEEKAIRLIRHAVDQGVNYLDTAFMYHGGNSETLVGKAIRDGYGRRSSSLPNPPSAAFRNRRISIVIWISSFSVSGWIPSIFICFTPPAGTPGKMSP